MKDQATVERVIEEVTREVLLRLSQTGNVASGPASGCNCTDGTCVQDCVENVERVVQAGAGRLSSTLGVRPQNEALAKFIDQNQMLHKIKLPSFVMRRVLTILLRFV